MKTILYSALALVLCIGISCSASKKTAKATEDRVVWVDSESSMEGFAYPQAGGTFQAQCYMVSGQDLQFSDMRTLETEANWEPLCGEIQGFQQTEGNYYKIRITKVKENIEKVEGGIYDASTWKLREMIEVKADGAYQKKEMVKAWIAPSMKEVRCLHPMAPADCKEMRYQMQDGAELNKTGEWTSLYDNIAIPGFQEGKYHLISYTRLYNPAMLAPVADGPNYEIIEFKLEEVRE